MHLELISRHPEIKVKSTPLLFVHGSFTEARVWDMHFLPYFAQQGYAAHAVSLRGHGASAGRDLLPTWSLADYVADLTWAIDTLERPAVLIGHSMGGMVIQKYLESHSAPGIVLMASTPPHGLLSSLSGMAASNPLLLQQLSLIQCFGARFATVEVMRQALFSDNTPDAQIRSYYSLLQGESQRVALDMLGLDPLRLKLPLNIPVLVMGGGKDAFFTAGLIKDMARTYGTEAVIFPDLAHALMLEWDWQQVADRLLAWLHTHFPDNEA